MTEIEAPGLETEAQPTTQSFGRRLAAERARLGLSVDEMAARLRLHPKQVQAIESESLPALPAPFLRGFVRNYAKELRLDPAPMIAQLNVLLGPQSGEPQGVGAGTATAGRGSPSGHGSRRVVLLGVLAVLVALAVVGGLATRNERSRVEAPPPAPVKPAAAVVPPPASLATEQKADPTPQPPPTAVETPAPVAAPAAAMPAAASAPAPAATSDLLRLRFRDQSWVEVTQADGRVLHSQINEAGTEQRIDGKPPLRVVIGNAGGVSIDYKGKPVDLKSATAADNVARITLN